MAIRNIVQVGDDVLRKKSAPVEQFDAKLAALLDDMKETLKEADGAGLAAVQVGVLRRAFVVDVKEGYFEFVNPVLVKTKGRQVGEEGCLSVRGKYGTVERPRMVEIRAFDRNGREFALKAYDFFARAVCHEYDHLDGVLYIDKATELKYDGI